VNIIRPVRQTEEDVINQTAQAYYRILASREQIRVQDSNISKLNRIIRATEGQYAVGLARKIDLDRIKVNLTNAQTLRTQQLNQVTTQTNQLKVLVGIPIENDITPVDVSLREIESQASEYVPLNEFSANNRTEIQVLDAQIRLTDLQTKSIKAEAYPRLSAFGNYGTNGTSGNFGDYFKARGEDFWYNTGSFGVRLNVPLFDGFARNSRAKISNIQSFELQKRKEATILSLNAGFQNARYQMANSINSIRAQKENVQLAEEVYNSSQVNYNLSLATLTDLLDAQTSFIQAQNSYTQALLDYKIAELETIRSQGNLRSLLQ
jgi:outer membrane protein TolC